MTSPRDPTDRPPDPTARPADVAARPNERGAGGGRRRRRQPEGTGTSSSSPLIVVALLSGLALVVGGAALFMTLTKPAPVAEGSCRTIAWNALPASDALPTGWSITASGFYTDGYGASFSGPAASGTQTTPPALNVRVSCFGSDGHLAVTRSHDSDLALGGSDLPFSDIGDEALATVDSSGTTTSVYVRRGPLVASIAAQGMASTDLEQAVSAIDDAMVTAEANVAESAPPQATSSDLGALPSDSLASDVPEPTATEAHAYPALEEILPKTVDGTALSSQSTTATDALSGDPTSDALFSWLSTNGKQPNDLEIAEAYDPTSTVDADFTAFRVQGIAPAELRQELVASWLGANASGITTTNKTIGGKQVLAIDYGDQGALDYVYEQGDAVVILSSSDPALVEKVLSGLK